MEALLIQWVQEHLDVIRYAAVVIGFVYSYYRRFVADQRDDRRELQKNDYIIRLTEDLTEANRLKDLVHETVNAHVNEKNILIVNNMELQQTIDALHHIIEHLQQRLAALDGLQTDTISLGTLTDCKE